MPKQNGKFQIALTSLIVVFLAILFYCLIANFSNVVTFFDTVNTILRPIYYGIILAFLLVPVHTFSYTVLDMIFKKKPLKHNVKNGLSVLFSILTAFFCVYLLLAMLLPQIYDSFQNLLINFPDEFSFTMPTFLDNFLHENPQIAEYVLPYLETALNSISEWIKTDIAPRFTTAEGLFSWAYSTLIPNLSGLVSGVSQWIIALVIFAKDIIIAIIVSIYLLAQKNTFVGQTKKLTYAIFPEKWAKFILFEVNNAYNILNGFINGKLLDSFIVGVICLIVCNILGFPYVPLLATIIGITNIIPYFGPFIGAIPCALLILTVSPMQCLYFIIFIIILQQFDGNILGPKILGESTGLQSFWVLFSVMLFGGLFGFAGMVLGVPIFATIYSMVSRLVKFLLKNKSLPTETEYYEIPIQPSKKITNFFKS